ncbi:MAG: ABC transporter ATP-binding protein [Bacteroidaceae bacterium]|nr:ABC transporter ATP-binding protein [Bacteroidaceae bacterium]MBR4516522.1 ABC transporter ATP-binding protein [Bacteroidaceae bacterium]
MIELQHLTVGYGEKAVLTDISQTLAAGQMVSLLGANGAGKSTLLRTLAGFQPPLAGKVLIDGCNLHSLSPAERSKAVSVVLTERVEVPYMKVEDLVGMGRSPYTGFFGRLDKEDRAIVAEAIGMVGIAHLAQRTVDTLSDGERQKALLAKALAQQTPIILLDEPTAFLDFHAKVSTLRLLLRLAHETNKTIFLSLHDVEMAIQLSDALWIVQDGEISTGTTASLTQSGTLGRFLQGEGITYDKEEKTLRIIDH